MAYDKQFDRKRMLETIDGLIEDINDTDIRDIDGGGWFFVVLCYMVFF